MNTQKKRNKEIIRYIVFGASTTIVNIALYNAFILFMDYRIANLIAIILCKIYAYAVNKIFVFRSHCDTWRQWFQELFRYLLSRGMSGIIDYFGVIACVQLIGLDQSISKYIMTGVVIILNYVLSKLIVFRKKKD